MVQSSIVHKSRTVHSGTKAGDNVRRPQGKWMAGPKLWPHGGALDLMFHHCVARSACAATQPTLWRLGASWNSQAEMFCDLWNSCHRQSGSTGTGGCSSGSRSAATAAGRAACAAAARSVASRAQSVIRCILTVSKPEGCTWRPPGLRSAAKDQTHRTPRCGNPSTVSSRNSVAMMLNTALELKCLKR